MLGTSPLEAPILKIRDEAKRKKIEERLSELVLSDDDITRVMDLFLDEMKLGLSKKPTKKSTLLMGSSFIPKLLDGTEDGDYMALDLGGTNFRVLLLKLRNGKIHEEIIEYYSVPESKRLGPVEGLFDFLAFCIYDFVSRKKIPRKNIQLGFTFSFPINQKALDVGILISWTKSFKCKGGDGRDVVKMLNDAIHRVGGLGITVNAVLNDTSGTLVKGSYLDKRCAIGIIMGTGSNACYMEHVSNVEYMNDTDYKEDHKDEDVIVGLEWGAFGDDGGMSFVKTEWDRLIDQQSLFTGSSMFEKCIGGKFLGELARECLLSLTKEGLFNGKVMDTLETADILTTTHLSEMEEDSFDGTKYRSLKIAETVLELREVSEDDMFLLQYVAGLFSYRAVQLVSAITAVLLNRMQKSHCTIAVDGSLYQHHPRFKPLMHHLIKKYAPKRPFHIILARDGSGKGAALVAAVADKLKKEKMAN